MRRFFLAILFLCVTGISFAQNNPRPSRSRFWQSKLSTFTVKPGDILIYNISSDSGNYNLIVSIKTYGDEISYDYDISEKNRKGSVSLAPAMVNRGTSYKINYTAKNNGPSCWLSKTSYNDIETEKQTKMNVGNGVDTFVRSNNSTLKINYKGMQKLITLYNIENSGTPKIRLGILNEPQNPLIVSVNAGYRITLKEVR